MVAAVLHLDVGAGAILQPVDQVAGGLAHSIDVVDAHPAQFGLRQVGARRAFLGVAQDQVHLGHAGEGRGVDLGGAASDDEPGARPFAARLADRLAGLRHGFGGDGAGVEDDGVGQAVLGRPPADDLALVGVQAAAESDDVYVCGGDVGCVRGHGSSPWKSTARRLAGPSR